jgi:hypothetical protein
MKNSYKEKYVNDLLLTVDLYVAPGDSHFVLADAVVCTLICFISVENKENGFEAHYYGLMVNY